MSVTVIITALKALSNLSAGMIDFHLLHYRKIKATDGSEKVFVAGDILFQDDTDKSPAKKVPKHWSGVVGDEPNQQVIIQVDRKPEVDNPGPGTL